MTYFEIKPLAVPVGAWVTHRGDMIEVLVTHAMISPDGKPRNRVRLPDGTDKDVARNQIYLDA